MRLLPTVLLAALLSAGCLADGPTAEGPIPAPPTAWSFGDGRVALERCRNPNCYEPTVAADPQGRLFVADGSTSAVAVSEDGGVTWDQRAPPAFPLPVDGVQSDVLLQVAPSGRLYWSALVVAQPGGAFALEGIQVAWSDDAAKTWVGSTHVSPATGTPQVLSPDRQWLGFAPDGTIYVTYNQIPTGIWVARSDDDGKTWSGWTRAAPLERRGGGIGQSGPPVVGPDGTLFVPACEGPGSGEASPRTILFRSPDRGATFEARTIDGMGCNWFPIAAVAPDGTVVLATQPDGVQVMWSIDGGSTFLGPRQWGQGAATAGVWPLVRSDGQAFVTWFEEGSSSTLHVSRGTLEAGPVEDLAVGAATGEGTTRTGARTDFASAALLPDGRLAVVWVEGNQAMVAVSASA